MSGPALVQYMLVAWLSVSCPATEASGVSSRSLSGVFVEDVAVLAARRALARRERQRESSVEHDLALQPGSEAAEGRPAVKGAKWQGDAFGPDGCVSVSRSSEQGTCVLSTQCGSVDISDVEFAFICFNPGTMLPHALHSFGSGGFDAEENFDTGVKCQKCSSLGRAFEDGSPSLRAALRSLPGGGPIRTPAGDAPEMRYVEEPKEASRFGPGACVSTWKSPGGTCIIRTACEKTEELATSLKVFDVGVTCLDKVGDYTRYLFGKEAFEAAETFDTRIECTSCLGVGTDPAWRNLNGILPKRLVEDVNRLTIQVGQLSERMEAMENGYPTVRANKTVVVNKEVVKIKGTIEATEEPTEEPAEATEEPTEEPAEETTEADTEAPEEEEITEAPEEPVSNTTRTPSLPLAPAPSFAGAPSAAGPRREVPQELRSLAKAPREQQQRRTEAKAPRTAAKITYTADDPSQIADQQRAIRQAGELRAKAKQAATQAKAGLVTAAVIEKETAKEASRAPTTEAGKSARNQAATSAPKEAPKEAGKATAKEAAKEAAKKSESKAAVIEEEATDDAQTDRTERNADVSNAFEDTAAEASKADFAEEEATDETAENDGTAEGTEEEAKGEQSEQGLEQREQTNAAVATAAFEEAGAEAEEATLAAGVEATEETAAMAQAAKASGKVAREGEIQKHRSAAASALLLTAAGTGDNITHAAAGSRPAVLADAATVGKATTPSDEPEAPPTPADRLIAVASRIASAAELGVLAEGQEEVIYHHREHPPTHTVLSLKEMFRQLAR